MPNFSVPIHLGWSKANSVNFEETVNFENLGCLSYWLLTGQELNVS